MMKLAPNLIAVAAQTAADILPATHLAQQLQLALVPANTTSYLFLLLQTSEYLMLYQTQTQQNLVVDFLTGAMRYRRAQGGRELLIRACRVKNVSALHIIDATAGLGRDAYILANQGHQLHLIERSPYIAALLADGLQRLAKTDTALAQRMQLVTEDAQQYLMQLAPHSADVVYLDPLFPERNKSAAVKKSMRLLHDLLPADDDADNLLAAAQQVARHRVIVKRPRTAPYLARYQPDLQFIGNSCRFDVYLNKVGK